MNNCTTHHICDCMKERMEKLERVYEAALEREWHYHGGDDAPHLEAAIAALEDLK